MNDIGYLIRRSFCHRGLLLAAVLASAVQCAMKIRLPLLMSYAVNAGLGHRDLTLVKTVGINMLVTCIVMGITGYCANLSSAAAGQFFSLDLRREISRRIFGFSVQQVSRFGAGSLITRLTTDADVCSMLFQALILLVLEPLFMTVGAVWMMWRIGPAFCAVFVLFVAAQLLVMLLFITKTAPGFVKIRASMDAMNSSLQSTFGNFRLIRAARTAPRESSRFDALNTELFGRSIVVQRRIAFFNPFIMLIMNLSVAAVLFLSGWEVQTGRLNIGMLLMAISYSEQVLMSIMAGGQMYRLIAETKPGASRLREILETEPDLEDANMPCEEPFGEFVFENVSFHYADGGSVLEGLDFSIKKGEMKAVIGPVGCGKSTVAALSARLYDVIGGRILRNGIDIRELDTSALRRDIALVEKYPGVVEGTVRSNIVFGRENLSEKMILKAAETAQFSAYLAQSTAVNMSGGERQRLGITRALAGNPGLLVLDESTSALDYETERKLLNALRRDYPDLAVLLITGRLPGALLADSIIILENGKASAEGTDKELRERSAFYRRNCEILERG